MKSKRAKARDVLPKKKARLPLPTLGVAMLLMNSCSPAAERVYIQRGYFLHSGDATDTGPVSRGPYLDWARDPEDQFRTIPPPAHVAEFIKSLRDHSYFSQKVRNNIPTLPDGDAIDLKVVAPATVIAELLPILQAREKREPQFRFSLCNECNQKPDLVIIALCTYEQSSCFGSFSYDQYGQSDHQTGDLQNGRRIIRGSNRSFQRIADFCPNGNLVSIGGPIDFGTSRVPWFEISEELSIQLLTGFSTFAVPRDDSDWSNAMSTLRTQIFGHDAPLTTGSKEVRSLSVFEGRNLSCRSKNTPATVERFMTLAVPSVKQQQNSRVCIVSGHEPTPKAQAELIARCAEFGASPILEIIQSRQN